MENNISKKQQLKEIVEKLKREKTYFSYEEIKTLQEKEKINMTAALFKKYIFEITKSGIMYNAGRGWYSSIKKDFELGTDPIKPIIQEIKKEFPLLDFSCWSTEQLNPFTHHLMVKFITFIYIDSDYMRDLYELLKNKDYNVYENPNKAEIEKQFAITNKTVVIRPVISKQPKGIENYSSIEKILIDFLIENKKLSIMDDLEAERVVNDALNTGKINISEFISYAVRREMRTPDMVTNSGKI